MSGQVGIAGRYAWLVRREIWEHRIIIWGPAYLAALIVVSSLASFLNGHHMVMDIDGVDVVGELHGPQAANAPACVAAVLTLMTLGFLALANLLQFYYSADALYTERAQRSILFWKSLPVSDRDTVLSKLLIAVVLMPLVALVAAVATELALSVVLAIQFNAPVVTQTLFAPAVWWHSIRLSLYAATTASLWFLPVVAWLLLVSAALPVARGMRLGRSPLLAAILLPLALVVAERLAFGTRHIAQLIGARISFSGWLDTAFHDPHDLVADLNAGLTQSHPLGPLVSDLMAPVQFATSPSVVAGLVAAGLMVAGAVHFRRRSESRG